jgi:hypothetical protein
MNENMRLAQHNLLGCIALNFHNETHYDCCGASSLGFAVRRWNVFLFLNVNSVGFNKNSQPNDKNTFHHPNVCPHSWHRT